jgi:hypothetical protein
MNSNHQLLWYSPDFYTNWQKKVGLIW